MYFDDGQVTLYQGHVLDVLRELPSESVQCCITSPPYWALRAYGTEPQVWGGDAGHEHTFDGTVKRFSNNYNEGFNERWGNAVGERKQEVKSERVTSTETCPCGAWRGELGHEPTPQMFVAHLVEVFREVRRVLKSDGVCFVNLGDSYASGGASGVGEGKNASTLNGGRGVGDGEKVWGAQRRAPVPPGTRAKSLVLIPERFALAAQDDGWYVRSRIAWCKRAPMPESVRDRPTNAWEHIWMLTKSARYYWDADAVREEALYGRRNWNGQEHFKSGDITRGHRGKTTGGDPSTGRNLWSYWLLSPDPEPLAHFATFPREIPRRCIAAATREGDTVLDPFVGSGTTTMVARSMLRRSIGIDLNETYLHDIALRKNAQMALIPSAEQVDAV